MLSMRGVHAAGAPDAELASARCLALIAALEAIADKAAPAEIAAAADGVRASCPEVEADAILIEAQTTWSPANAEAVEARALSSTSSRARRWAARQRLRRLPLDALAKALPKPVDAETLALQLAATALFGSSNPQVSLELGRLARELAYAEPTVARMVAAVARRAGLPSSDPLRASACALSRTDVEKQACSG